MKDILESKYIYFIYKVIILISRFWTWIVFDMANDEGIILESFA